MNYKELLATIATLDTLTEVTSPKLCWLLLFAVLLQITEGKGLDDKDTQ